MIILKNRNLVNKKMWCTVIMENIFFTALSRIFYKKEEKTISSKNYVALIDTLFTKFYIRKAKVKLFAVHPCSYIFNNGEIFTV